MSVHKIMPGVTGDCKRRGRDLGGESASAWWLITHCSSPHFKCFQFIPSFLNVCDSVAYRTVLVLYIYVLMIVLTYLYFQITLSVVWIVLTLNLVVFNFILAMSLSYWYIYSRTCMLWRKKQLNSLIKILHEIHIRRCVKINWLIIENILILLSSFKYLTTGIWVLQISVTAAVCNQYIQYIISIINF